MRIRKFRGTTIPLAIAKVKKEFGDEAVIISTKYFKGDKSSDYKSYVEVTAAIDFEGDISQSDIQKDDVTPTSGRHSLDDFMGGDQIYAEKEKRGLGERLRDDNVEIRQSRKGEYIVGGHISQNESTEKIFSELRDIVDEMHSFKRTMLELRQSISDEGYGEARFGKVIHNGNLTNLWGDLSEIQWALKSFVKNSFNDFIDFKEEIPFPLKPFYRHLFSAGVDPLIIKLAIRRIHEKIERGKINNNSEILENIIVETLEEMLVEEGGDLGQTNKKEQEIIALVGLTGVGKTTTIAKMSSIYSQKLRKKTLLLSLDHYRVEISDQLKIYARALGVNCETLLSPEMLRKKIGQSSNFDTIFIDTIGTNEKSNKRFEEMVSLFANLKNARKFLVLQSSSREQEMLECLRQFKRIGVDKLIFSKIDEASNFGTLFNFIVKTKLPVMWLTNGQKIPNDIIPASKKKLVSLLLGETGVHY